MAGNGGKGSKQRPLLASTEQFDKNWDVIFGKKEISSDEIINDDEKSSNNDTKSDKINHE